MIIIKNVSTIKGEIIDHEIASDQDEIVDGVGLTLLPALIDPHVHFRVPGEEQKEDWQTGARAAVAGGVTTVFDMPNNVPPAVDAASLTAKKRLIDTQLSRAKIPLHYYLYFGATADNLDEMKKVKNEMVGVKLFMGPSMGNLSVNKKDDQEKIFKKAAELNLMVAVHAEDESTINNQQLTINNSEVADHSKMRPREAAIRAVTQAIELAKKCGTKLYILHISAKEEVDLVGQAKKDGARVYAEVSPHHLFLNESNYEALGNKAKVNPPLRTAADNAALWEGIKNGTIDTIGSDHAPHTLAEKAKIYTEAPSGAPGIENYLALLLNARSVGKISLNDIVRLTHDNPQQIFGLKPNDDAVLLDLNKTKVIKDEEQKTKCGWSPYAGMEIKGWPVCTILRGRVF